ncbi:MAG TPA: hypothetical protein VFA18_06890, partial [Gemmataceae bacterium]|nr:hypothetical protein [Gemmataceae bacterium]
EAKSKTELLVILTPHIVRNRAEADAILAEESQRMDWVLGDVIKTHGASGMAPILPPPPKPSATGDNSCASPAGPVPPGGPDMMAPPAEMPTMPPAVAPQVQEPVLPQPRMMPAPGVPGPTSAAPAASTPAMKTSATDPVDLRGQVSTGSIVPQEQGTEVQVWRSSNMAASNRHDGSGN